MNNTNNKRIALDVLVHTCKLSTRETEAGGLL